MKKKVILGLILMLSLTGCTVDMFDSFGDFDSKYQFGDYKSFADIKEEADDDRDYFVIDTFKTMSVNDVETIDVASIFADIEIIKEKRDDVLIRYYGVFSDKNSEKKLEYDIETSDTFKYHVKWKKHLGSSRAKLTIYVPDSYEGNFDVSSISGDVSADEILGEALNTKTISGDIQIDRVEVESSEFSSTSGDVKIDELFTESLLADLISGDIHILLLETETLDIGTVSGDIAIVLEEQNSDIEIESISGDVKIEVRKAFNAKIDLRTVSGDISFKLSLEDIEINKDHRLKAEIGNGQYDLNIDTVSGDIIVQ